MEETATLSGYVVICSAFYSTLPLLRLPVTMDAFLQLLRNWVTLKDRVRSFVTLRDRWRNSLTLSRGGGAESPGRNSIQSTDAAVPHRESLAIVAHASVWDASLEDPGHTGETTPTGWHGNTFGSHKMS